MFRIAHKNQYIALCAWLLVTGFVWTGFAPGSGATDAQAGVKRSGKGHVSRQVKRGYKSRSYKRRYTNYSRAKHRGKVLSRTVRHYSGRTGRAKTVRYGTRRNYGSNHRGIYKVNSGSKRSGVRLSGYNDRYNRISKRKHARSSARFHNYHPRQRNSYVNKGRISKHRRYRNHYDRGPLVILLENELQGADDISDYQPCPQTRNCNYQTSETGPTIIRLGDPRNSSSPKLITFEGN